MASQWSSVRLLRNTSSRGLLLAVVWVISLGCASGQTPFTGRYRQSAESPGKLLAFVESRSIGQNNFLHVFRVTNKQTGEQFPITLGDPSLSAAQAESSTRIMRLVKYVDIIDSNRAIVVGVNHFTGDDMISILDFDRRAVVDQFLGRGYTFSPNKEYLAYEKYATRAFLPTMSSQILVYSLTAPPEQNRFNGKIADPEDVFNVGIPVYPPNSQNIQGDNHNVPEAMRHQRVSTFFWLANASVLLFRDILQTDSSLIVIDLRQGVSNRSIYTAAISPTMLENSPCKSFIEKGDSFGIVGAIASGRGPEYVDLDIQSGTTSCGHFSIAFPGLQLR